jgi:hypothetical protein
MTMIPKQGRAAKVLELVRVKRDAEQKIASYRLPIGRMSDASRRRVDELSREREAAARELLRLAAENFGTFHAAGVEIHVTQDGDGTAIFDEAGEVGLPPGEPFYAKHVSAVRRDAFNGARAYRARVAQGQLR